MATLADFAFFLGEVLLAVNGASAILYAGSHMTFSDLRKRSKRVQQ